MVKRDPAKTARNREIAAMSAQLTAIQRHVMHALKEPSVQALHGRIGGKNANFIDVRNEVIHSPEGYCAAWLRGLMSVLDNRRPYNPTDGLWGLFDALRDDPIVKDYVLTFLKRTYLRNYEALSRIRPTLEDSEMWLGQNHANYGLLVTPRFRHGQWENDKSEIRHFERTYFTIGHVLHTGLVVPARNSKRDFGGVDDYLQFFEDVLVRSAGSVHQDAIASLYSQYVRSQPTPEEVPLLLPEFRYLGQQAAHRYRLDFMVVDPFTMQKVGFELSPWSTHGALRGTKTKTQAKLNAEAKLNREREMRRHKEFFKGHDIFALIYTDEDLADPGQVFGDITRHLQPQQRPQQLELHALDELERFEV